MARRKIFWHIGPDDLGTSFLADALDVRRKELAAAGVLVPGNQASWHLATVELRRNHQQLGYHRREVEGQNAALVRQIWKHQGPTVLSMPGLAAATPDQVALALDALRGAEIHLVLVVRDLTSQAYAAVQSALELGATSRPRDLVERVLDADPGEPQARAFRAGHDLPDILLRWARSIPPTHVHVIAQTEAEPIWRRLMALVGAEGVAPPDTCEGTQLGVAQLTALRETRLAVDDRLDARGRRLGLRELLSRDLLAGPGAPRLPVVDAGDRLVRWTDYVHRRGYDMQGSFTEQGRTVADPGATSEESLAAALADAVVEVARLRVENQALTEENSRLERKRRKHKRRARELDRQVA